MYNVPRPPGEDSKPPLVNKKLWLVELQLNQNQLYEYYRHIEFIYIDLEVLY